MIFPSALALAATSMIVLERARRPLGVFCCLAATAVAGYGFLAAYTLPHTIEKFKPIRPLARIIASEHRPGDRIGLFRDVGQGFVFYAGQPVSWLRSPAEVASFLAGPGRWFLVVYEQDYRWIRRAHRGRLHVLGEVRSCCVPWRSASELGFEESPSGTVETSSLLGSIEPVDVLRAIEASGVVREWKRKRKPGHPGRPTSAMEDPKLWGSRRSATVYGTSTSAA